MSKRPAAPRGSRTTPSDRDRRAPATQQRSPSPATGPRPTRGGGTQPVYRAGQRRATRGRARRPWWRGPLPIIGTLVVVAALVVVFVVVSNNNGGGSDALIGKPFPASLQQEVTSVPASVIAAVGTGGLPQPYVARSGPALTSGGKPELLFVGAEYCPHCAAERWSLVNALSRFGTFSNLSYMRSATTDGDIATITFNGASYDSPYLTFLPIENADRNGNQLQSLTPQQQSLFVKYGGSGYPFLDFAGQYTNDAPHSFAGGYDYSVLSGMDWSAIAGALKDAGNPVTKAVIGNANYLTAAICAVTHNRPAGACTTTIQRIEQQLPKHS